MALLCSSFCTIHAACAFFKVQDVKSVQTKIKVCKFKIKNSSEDPWQPRIHWHVGLQLIMATKSLSSAVEAGHRNV